MYDWIISDTHFYHDNIIRYAGRPKNHVELMLRNWRNLVMPDDTVLHLGDVLMNREELWKGIGWLPGKVSVLSTGNHDEPHKKQWIQRNWDWKFIPEFTIEYRGYDILFSHYPEETLPPHSINVHGHIHQLEDPSPFHINVSIERMDYRPMKLREILDKRIGELES